MAKLLSNKPQNIQRPITTSPLPPRFVMEYISLHIELEEVKQRLSELENWVSKEKVIVLRNITREELKQEIRNLFSNGQTLYYSDIAERLGVDLKSVVDVCRELQENKEIGIDEDALARTL